MNKNISNRLITSELEKKLLDFPLYSQEGKGKEAECLTQFNLGNARWYILEGERRENDFILFGIVIGLAENEYGYMSANEMASVSVDASAYGGGILRVEQQKNFIPCPLQDIHDNELQYFLKRFEN